MKLYQVYFIIPGTPDERDSRSPLDVTFLRHIDPQSIQEGHGLGC